MRIIIVAFEGAQGLDIFGPAEVFASATLLGQAPYEIVFAAAGGGRVRLTSGGELIVSDLLRVRTRRSDTVLVVGGEASAIEPALADARLISWLRRAASGVARIGSVCSGAFLLARTGVLDGLRVATHWSACRRLAAFRPQTTVDPNAIFVRNGSVWTSAGVTTGIDMALAMVEQDIGRAVADAIAGRLVLHARRPGFQSQFSDALIAQTDASSPLAPTMAWLRANIRREVGLRQLARRAGLSVRSLHRHCNEYFGCSPAKLIERVRVEEARTLLGTTALGGKVIAGRCGFGNAQRMTRAFKRTIGVTPKHLRLLTD